MVICPNFFRFGEGWACKRGRSTARPLAELRCAVEAPLDGLIPDGIAGYANRVLGSTTGVGRGRARTDRVEWHRMRAHAAADLIQLVVPHLLVRRSFCGCPFSRGKKNRC